MTEIEETVDRVARAIDEAVKSWNPRDRPSVKERAARAAIAAMPSPVQHACRDEIAAYLMARDESGQARPLSSRLLEWGLTCVFAGKNAKHSGDCTNECHSCGRCITDTVLADADAILAAAMPSPWKDISSAPKDGTWILIAAKDLYPCDAHWSRSAFDDTWDWTDSAGLFATQPTHWMPLPAGPEA